MKRTHMIFTVAMVAFGICFHAPLFGRDAEVVYIDSGVISYCQSFETVNMAVKLYARDITSDEIRTNSLPCSLYTTYGCLHMHQRQTRMSVLH